MDHSDAPESPGGSPDDLLGLVHDVEAVVWELDPRTMRFTFVSRHAEELLGRPVSAWRDFDAWVSFIHPEDRARTRDFCLRETSAGNDHDFEYRAITADGRVVWLRDIVRLGRDAEGGVTALRGVIVDITERRLTQATQAALHRVADAAASASLDEVYTLVLTEATALLGAAGGALTRQAEDDPEAFTVVARMPDYPQPPRDMRLAAGGPGAQAFRTGVPARVDDIGALRPLPVVDYLIRQGIRSAVAVPVTVAGARWGSLTLLGEDPLPRDTEARLAEFAHLVELAISNAEANEARRHAEAGRRRQAAEQEALARIAINVAEDRPPQEVFGVAAEAVATALEAEVAAVFRFVGEDLEVLGIHNTQWTAVGTRLPMEVAASLQQVRRTGRAARFTPAELSADDAVGDRVRTEGLVSVVIGPVFVAGTLWGGVGVGSRAEDLPADTEERLEHFARLAATAVSHADARARLVHQATTDPLTGLANHRVFQERLRTETARAKRHGRPLTLVLIDLDEFKSVNDAYGHEIGDRALAEVGARLSELVRPGDLLARTGGDEFAWILAETDAMDGYAAAERARLAITSTPLLGRAFVNASAGVCDIDQAEGPESLLRLADGALYWAKANGRSVTYRYSPEVVRELSAAERTARLVRQQALSGLRALARAVDAKDHSTHEHSERVAGLATRLAAAMGWDQTMIAALGEAALLHDVGKIGVPDAVLFKPDRLTPAEYQQVKEHAALGATIASEVLSDEQVAWIRGHHERHDGAGYPDRLAGEDIPEGARILALADAWDVMTHVRSYKSSLTPEEAMRECLRHSGGQFWPDAVDALQGMWAAGMDMSHALESRYDPGQRTTGGP